MHLAKDAEVLSVHGKQGFGRGQFAVGYVPSSSSSDLSWVHSACPSVSWLEWPVLQRIRPHGLSYTASSEGVGVRLGLVVACPLSSG